MSGKAKGEIRKTYPSGKQYSSFPETKEGLVDLDAFNRRRDGADSWQIAKRFVI